MAGQERESTGNETVEFGMAFVPGSALEWQVGTGAFTSEAQRVLSKWLLKITANDPNQTLEQPDTLLAILSDELRPLVTAFGRFKQGYLKAKPDWEAFEAERAKHPDWSDDGY